MDPIAELEEENSDLEDNEREDGMLEVKKDEIVFGRPIYIPEHIEELSEEEKKKQLELLEEEEYYEVNSRIGLRSGRLVSTRELKDLAENKPYIELDSINIKNTEHSFYTVGIICNRSPIKFSKTKICFIELTFTSLKKSNAGGYKTLPVFIYGNVSREFAKVELGSVYCIIGPSIMPKNLEYEYALKVTQRSQLVKIGKSLDFDYCEHVDKNTEVRCMNFINAAIEHYCDMHKKIKKLEEKVEEKVASNAVTGTPTEFNKLASFIKKRSEQKDYSNQLCERLKMKEKKEEIVELAIEDTNKDDDLIKRLMEKKNKSFFAQRFKSEGIKKFKVD